MDQSSWEKVEPGTKVRCVSVPETDVLFTKGITIGKYYTFMEAGRYGVRVAEFDYYFNHDRFELVTNHSNPIKRNTNIRRINAHGK